MDIRHVVAEGARRAVLSLVALALPLWSAAAMAGETTITVSGTLSGGHDRFGIFGMPNNILPAGTPFTLVYTFDAAKGQSIKMGNCADSGSGIAGNHKESPGTAILTINGKSYEFGRKPDARSLVRRSIVSSCSTSQIRADIMEGQSPLQSAVGISIVPVRGESSLTQNPDWRSPVSLSHFYAQNMVNAFIIKRPGDYANASQSYFAVSTVTISTQ